MAGGRGTFNTRLWEKKEVALITTLRIFSTHIIVGLVRGYDIRMVPSPHQKRGVGSRHNFE